MEPKKPENPEQLPRKMPGDVPVRRVGSLTLGVCLVAAGAFFLCYYFLPGFHWKLMLKIAPAAGLCMLGAEMLFFAARPQRGKYDFLSVLLCLLLMAVCFGMSFLPVLLERFGPEAEARETQIASEYEDALYTAFRRDAADIRLKDLSVWLRDYYGTAETLEDAAGELKDGLGTLHLNVELYGPYDQKEAFAADCRALTDCIQKQTAQPTVVTFFYDGIGQAEADGLDRGTTPAYSYQLTLSGRVQLDWTEDQMCQQTEETSLLDEENDALSEE